MLHCNKTLYPGALAFKYYTKLWETSSSSSPQSLSFFLQRKFSFLYLISSLGETSHMQVMRRVLLVWRTSPTTAGFQSVHAESHIHEFSLRRWKQSRKRKPCQKGEESVSATDMLRGLFHPGPRTLHASGLGILPAVWHSHVTRTLRDKLFREIN